jgi:esterase/lipase superfamily enzyme
MANEWHVDWLKEGVTRWNHRRKRVQFNPDLSGIRFFDHLPQDYREDPKTSRYFEKLDLSGANLERSDLSGLNFSRAKFVGANLTHANLSKSNFQNADFTRANLSEADGTRAAFNNATFEDTKVDQLTLNGASIQNAIFISTELSKAQAVATRNQTVSIYSSRKERNESKEPIARFGYSPPDEEQAKGKSKKTSYDVFYGTNRGPIFERGALVGFDGNKQNTMRYGLCEVIIPDGHRIGKIGTRLFRFLRNKRNSELRVDRIVPLSRDLFWAHLLRTSEKMKEKARPTIFIHGYNTSFEEAVLRAAQIGHDLGIGQGIGLFSWPSKGEYLKYSADEASAEVSKYDLADFLEGYVQDGSNFGINIIAHSMGCRVLLAALELLESRNTNALSQVHQVILAAADVDANIMPRIGRPTIENAERLTSYVSGKDTALRISGWLHSFPRIGKAPPTFVINGMDTIIVNNMDLGAFSHAYLGSSRVILSDIFSILKNELPPEKRHSLEMVEDGLLPYWRKKD